MGLQQYSTEQMQEMSFIEIAYELLAERKQPVSFKEILDEITKALNLSEQEVKARIAQFYTDLNIDGRFMSLGENRWGLRVWYPVDHVQEDAAPTVKPKKKKAKKVKEEEDFDEVDEDEDLGFDDVDEFDDDDEDLLDDDDDDVFDEEIDDDDTDEDDTDDFEEEEIIDEEYDLDDDEEELDEEEEPESKDEKDH